MKKIIVDTKHGGKVAVRVFETVEEAVKTVSAETVLKNLNRMFRIDTVNEANRQMSITAKLKRAVKDGKLTEATLQSLLNSLDKVA